MLENSYIEFKREYSPDIKKEVLAFANTSGGTIYIGKDDKGNTYPLVNISETLTQITNSLRDSIAPDVTLFLGYDTSDGFIKINVMEGINKPYYLKERGLKPSGVYVRQGASSVPASLEQIRQMIKLTDGDKYENLRSLNQDLTFQTADNEFIRKNIDFGDSQKKTLGILGADKLYTNLGILISDQCFHTIKLAVFRGVGKGEFKTRKEIGGSILSQVYSAFDFLSLSNNLNAAFSGLDRIEQYDYPPEAIREAMLNAVVHRDYSFSGSIIVNIYDDRMEFVSLGGLPTGLEKEDLFSGVSQPRNDKLANIFYRLKHIESYGTGLKKIMSYYENLPVKPDIQTTNATFTLVLPNINYITLFLANKKDNPQFNLVLDYLQRNEIITNEILQDLLSVRQTRAYAIIKKMLKSNLIKKRGGKKNGEYVLCKCQVENAQF